MLSGLLARLRLDPRLSSMIAALIVIAIVLNVMTHGLFLSPENLYNLSIQTCVIGRLGRPEDIANTVAFFASPRSGFTVGQNLHVDGGYMQHVPF